MIILGIIGEPGSDCHDSSAALYIDGKIVAAAEQERFSRRKHANAEAPYDAAQYCLASQNLTLDDIDFVAISWEPDGVSETLSENETKEVVEKLFPRELFTYTKYPKCCYVQHHLTHLAASFYQSGFSEAACIIVDGQGENESITLAAVKDNKIEKLREFPIAYSLGAFYDAAAGYAGLGFTSPGKFMGLSPYGYQKLKFPIRFDPEKGEIVNPIVNPHDSFYEARTTYLKYFEENIYPFHAAPFESVQASELMLYSDFAASVQEVLNNLIIDMARYLKKETGFKNLVMAGGVTLNCTSNGVLDRENVFDNIFIFPAANDGGCSLGAALELAREKGEFDHKLPERIGNVYFGKEYSDNEIENYLKNRKFHYEYLNEDDFPVRIGELLNQNKIIAWMQKGFEFGPRALGARSILCSPCLRENTNRVNIAKNRELWRPLSPVVLDKFYSDIFEDEKPYNMSEFMLKTCKIKDNWVKRIPAVTHVDQTSRPQYLKRQYNNRLYDVIEKFYHISGVPLIINTSFNTKNQPIINSPLEALMEYESNLNLDYLVMGSWLIRRNGDATQ